MQLNSVAKTAIATLRSRAIESRKERAIIDDPLAVISLERLEAMATSEERTQLFVRPLSSALTTHIALRARKYDALAETFIRENPSGLVVNLGCGFDTRYWRIDHGRSTYIELDLPEIIELKRRLLGDRIDYLTIGTSVLDHSWMARVNPGGTRRCLLIAEGLLMYLPKEKVVALFRAISDRFKESRMVVEVVTEKYTRGLWKRIVVAKMRRQLGYDAGSSYSFGVHDAREIETYGAGLRVIGEWSYVEDADLRPRILRHLGISRTQWTVILSVNAGVDTGRGKSSPG